MEIHKGGSDCQQWAHCATNYLETWDQKGSDIGFSLCTALTYYQGPSISSGLRVEVQGPVIFVV